MIHIPVLMYHRVSDEDAVEGNDYIVRKETFERQLRYFSLHGYQSLSVEAALRNARSRTSFREKPLIITFDDGYVDTLDTAVPLLHKYGFSATVFVMPNPVLRVNSWDIPHAPEAKLMELAQITRMKDLGLEIGSHGWSHRSLPMLNDAELALELVQSKRAAEELLNQPVRYLAYPYGEVNERVERKAKEAGYECAFATNSGSFSFAGNLFHIRRTTITDRADNAYLRFKLSGLEKALHCCWSFTKRMTGRKPLYHPV